MRKSVTGHILPIMADIEIKQFKLTDEGAFLFQPDSTNPLPGKPVGKIEKGDDPLRPNALPQGSTFSAEELASHLQNYINEVLEPLATLGNHQDLQEPAKTIADKLYAAMGILPRSDLEESIAGLDEEGRTSLRSFKIRLGPVLVFLPLLNKPAAIRLRALLWNLWHDKQLPASVPPDGVTSISVEQQTDADPLYYQSIGYPLYGPRAVRVDMLDRLICSIYDHADKGQFQAKHEMAEWLGCPIPDLYGVLEAMGHKKANDPAEEQIKDKVAKADEETSASQSDTKEESKDNTDNDPQEGEEKKADKNVAQVKPELATFILKRGKAYGESAEKQKRKPRKKVQKQDNKKHRKPKKPHNKKPSQPRVISAAAPEKSEENSPFAALKGLKVQNKE